MDQLKDNTQSLFNYQNRLNQNINISISNNVNNQYNPFAIPGSLEIAKTHGLACKITLGNVESPCEFCICCQRPITNESINVTKDNLQKLGISFVIYFELIKLCIIMLACMYLPLGISNLIGLKIYSSNDAIQNSGFLSFIFNPLEAQLQNKYYYLVSSILQIAVIFLIVFIYVSIKYNYTKSIKKYNDNV